MVEFRLPPRSRPGPDDAPLFPKLASARASYLQSLWRNRKPGSAVFCLFATTITDWPAPAAADAVIEAAVSATSAVSPEAPRNRGVSAVLHAHYLLKTKLS